MAVSTFILLILPCSGSVQGKNRAVLQEGAGANIGSWCSWGWLALGMCLAPRRRSQRLGKVCGSLILVLFSLRTLIFFLINENDECSAGFMVIINMDSAWTATFLMLLADGRIVMLFLGV